MIKKKKIIQSKRTLAVGQITKSGAGVKILTMHNLCRMLLRVHRTLTWRISVFFLSTRSNKEQVKTSDAVNYIQFGASMYLIMTNGNV